ncbi:MAG TPA: hypothetical protein PKY56_06035 [Candidatus Kapabacteria bacterium]|nr:hypothetical protein [Candidatus Kapabacteria bacterium]HPO63638.1 hypothetical protein [Candidatus Kapabacteria bacterium]
MKKLVCLFIIFIAYFANSQDFEPTQTKFNWGYGGNETYLSADSAYFKQDKFLRGWHWGASKKISHAVGVNQNDAHRTVTADKLDSNCHIILKPDEYTHGNEHRILNARAIQYEPTLTLNPNNPSELVIRQGDTTRPVFGFLNRRGRILTDSTDPNFNRLIIDSSSLVNQVILSEPWPSNQLSLALIGEKRIDSIMNTFLCKSLFFSINLRRAGSEMNNDTVLKIELPYTYLVDSTYVNQSNDTSHYKVSRNRNIQFWNLPSPAQYPNGTYELTNGRGCVRDTIPLNISDVRAIFITKQMLPPNNKDITISALFRCNGDISRNNHLLKDENADTLEIDSIKIKITYLGGGPLMIDWVRIETPHAKNFLSGKFDERFLKKDD